MNVKELRELSADGLVEALGKLRREQFNLRMQAATGQGTRPDQKGKTRREIARIKTILCEQKAAEAAEQAK